MMALVAVCVVAAALWFFTRTAGDSSETFDPGPAVACTDDAPSAILEPGCGAWLGSTDRDKDSLDLATQESTLGRQFDLVRLYEVGPDATFFSADHQRLADQGRTLVYSWKVSTDGPTPWARVAAGEFDTELARAAEEIVASGHTVLFSLHHEPEDDATERGGSFGTNADYVAMMRRAHEVMEPIGGDQIIWFVNYMGHSFGTFEQVEAMYPGDDVVDWISWNPYNWFGCNGDAPWKSFATQAAPFYEWAVTNHPGKPLMIGETATNEDPNDAEAKAEWIDALSADLPERFPNIRAVLWFQQSSETGFCERRWDSSFNSTDAFTSLAETPYFNPTPQ